MRRFARNAAAGFFFLNALGSGLPGDILYVHHAPDPVNVRNGNFYLPVQDSYLPCFGFPLEVYRSYNSFSSRNGSIGKGWTLNYDLQVVFSEKDGLRITEPDGFVLEYKPVESEERLTEAQLDQITKTKKEEDVRYTRKPSGKGETFYIAYRRQIQTEPEFARKQADRYLPSLSKISPSGKYISRTRGLTRVEKTASGYVRTLQSGRRESFTTGGLLTRLTDRNDNFLALAYDKQSRLDTVTDGCGQSLKYAYSPHGKVAEIKDSLGRKLTYTYDDLDHLTSATTLEGGKVTFSYDKRDRLTKILFPDGDATAIEYDLKSGAVTKQSGPGKKITTYRYSKDRFVRSTSVEDNEGVKNRYEYDETRHTVAVTDAAGKKTLTTLLPCCGKPTSILNEKGKGETFRYDEVGNLLAKTDEKNKQTTYVYEPRFHLPSEIHQTDGTKLLYRYDDRGNLNYVTKNGSEFLKIGHEMHGKVSSLSAPGDVEVLFTYSSFGKPTKIEKKVKGHLAAAIVMEYGPFREIQLVTPSPNKPETTDDVRSTLASFLSLLEPTGIDVEL